MSVDPGVRFVRVAVVVSERFAEILKGPQTVRDRCAKCQPSTYLDGVRRKPADVLHRELEVRIRQALATHLRRVGP